VNFDQEENHKRWFANPDSNPAQCNVAAAEHRENRTTAEKHAFDYDCLGQIDRPNNPPVRFCLPRPDQVELLAKRLGVTEHNVIDMNRRLGGDASLNAPIREDGDAGERQDWLVDDSPSQERILVKNEELQNRHESLMQALSELHVRERRIFEARRLAEDPIPLGVLALEFGVSGERVRQIEARAFEKVQKAVQRRVAAIEQNERRHHVSHPAQFAA
jgi:RNA polymerase sigma factor (sigma-70 family)